MKDQVLADKGRSVLSYLCVKLLENAMDQSRCLCGGKKRDWLLHSKCISVGLGLNPAVHFQHRTEKHMSLSSGSSASCGDDAMHNVKGEV